ncbi:MAG: hypothetical protein U0S48_18225 [Solirubrobacteraceae bacterium]
MRRLRAGIDDGSGDVFIADPTIPVASPLGVELLSVNAALTECWSAMQANRALGLPTAHHESEYDELAQRQQAIKRAIEAGDQMDPS